VSGRIRLFTPGPVSIPAEVLLEMARPIIHHRTAEFRRIVGSVTEKAQYMFQTSSTVLTLAASGTGGMEAALASSIPAEKKALVVRGGKFSERWAQVCQAYGIETICHDVEWGCGVEPAVIADYLNHDPDIAAVVITHSETSTGAAVDLEQIAAIVRETPALLVVDGITAVGALPFKMDDWGVDIAVVGSQKACLMPPGLAFVAVSDKAWKQIDATKPRGLYLDLRRYRKSIADSDTPFTPAIGLILAADKALGIIRERGMETIWRQTALLARATREAVKAMGLTCFAKSPSDSVTAVNYPDGVDDAAFRKWLRETFSAWIAGGQAKLKGKIFRISHMGQLDALDAIEIIAGVELALQACGAAIEPGAGVAAAQKILKDW